MAETTISAISAVAVERHGWPFWSVNVIIPIAQVACLIEEVAFVYHNGTDVYLLKTYQSLRRANVVSTRTLCKMAIPRRVPIHLVSTASVAKVVQHQSLLEVSPSTPQQVDYELLNTVDGYAASKWASEALLERLAADNGLRVYVHRVAHVVGRDAFELDAVGMLTKYSLIFGVVPHSYCGRGYDRAVEIRFR
jgi:thioester reductase-like protein